MSLTYVKDVNMQKAPKAMKRFHAHVYFNLADIQAARILLKQAKLNHEFELVKIHEKPVGPHPTSMIEMHFSEDFATPAVEWLKANHGEFSVLIHEDIDDDYKAHTENIEWLGAPLSLDFTFFDLIQKRPELRINPKNK